MKPKKSTKGAQHVVHEVEGVATGALAGAVVGMAAGPAGIVAGAIAGGVAGGLAASAMESAAAVGVERTRILDEEIGVSGGDMGAPNLKHPPARIGAYSTASTGSGAPASDEEPAEGPMQAPED